MVYRFISAVVPLLILGFHGQTKELSLISPRALRDTIMASSDLKKAIVDLETDVFSLISPLTLSGTKYPWRIFTQDVAKAQSRALDELDNNIIGGSLNPTKGVKLLSSSPNDVHFHLYQNRRDFNSSIIIDVTRNPWSQNILQVRPGDQVKILIHGFQSGPSLAFTTETKDGMVCKFMNTYQAGDLCGIIQGNIGKESGAYLGETSHSVIVVDWEVLALPKNKIRLLLYPAVTVNAFKVGEKVAMLIAYMLETGMIADLSQVHIIGHSLGAHAAGYAGDLTFSRFGRKIGRITALDAAFLAFIGPQVKLRLDKGDAKFVDAIHTSGIGVYDPIAHADFYPNGGRNQVSCYKPETYRANAVSDSGFSRAFEQIIQSCSHARAYHYFVKSIKKENFFWSCKCVSWKDYRTFCKDSCAHRERFGEYVSPTARGKYYLEIDP